MANKLSSHWPISISNGFAALFNLFLPLALVRIIPPDQVGRYKVFFLYVTFAPGIFFVSGLSNGLYHWAGRYPKTQSEMRQSWGLLWIFTIPLTLLGLCLMPQISQRLHMPIGDLLLFLLYCPIGLAGLFIEDLMIARGDIWAGSLYGSGFQTLRSLACLAAAFWGRRVEYVFIAFFGSSIIRTVTGILLMQKTGDVQPAFSKDKSIAVLRYAIPVSVAALGGLALANADQLILSMRLNPTAFAFYSIGCLTVPPLQILEMSVNRVLIPNLSKALADHNSDAAAGLFSEGVSELFRFLLPATAGLVLFAHPIIRLLFTDRYASAAQYLPPYALFYLFMSVPYDAVARAVGDGVWILRLGLVFGPLSLLNTWLGASYGGAMGALFGFLATQLLLRCYAIFYQKRRIGKNWSLLPFKQMGLLLSWVVLLGALAWFSRPLFHGDMMWFLTAGSLFTVLYLLGAYGVILRTGPQPGPIRILELVQFLSVGGLERMVYTLSQALHRDEQFKPLVATYDGLDDNLEASLVPQFKEAGIPVMQWEKKTGFSPQTVTRLVKVIFEEKKRIIHAHDLGPLIYGSLAKCFSFGRVRLVVTLHTLFNTHKNVRYRFYLKYFLRMADVIIAVSPAVKSGLLELGIEARRIKVVPNGVKFGVPILNPAEKQELKKHLLPKAGRELLDARWILYLARLHSVKGQDTALRLWRGLSTKARSKLFLIFVGPESDKAYSAILRQDIETLEDRNRIILAGPSQTPEMWLAAADLFLSCSKLEGMPLAPLEAVGSGLPVVLSNIPGHDLLKPLARLFDLSMPQEGSRHITDVLADIETEGDEAFFRQRWKAAQSLREKWSETAMVSSYMDVFKEVSKSTYAAASH